MISAPLPRPCQSPYCECEAGKCSRPGYYDARGTAPSRPGYDALWLWFDLSYASWLTLPRVLMHEMPDAWQARMAVLLQEWHEHWDTHNTPRTRVQAVADDGRITRFPRWLLNYRHPDREAIQALRAPTPQNHG